MKYQSLVYGEQRKKKLEEILTKDGLNVYMDHSEKGWVEVTINQ
jgi:hypothetical protein